MGLFGILERHYRILITLLALLLAVGYVHKLNRTHKGEENFEYGYYPYEKWKEGEMRWTWRKALTRVEAASDLFGFRVVVRGYNSTGPEGLTFKVFLDGKMLDEVRFFDGGLRYLYYYVPGSEGKEVEIGTEVDRTFNLLRMKINEDGRELGVALSPIVFLKIMPKDGIGFYKWEIWGGVEREALSGKERMDGGGDEKDGKEERAGRRFRWTGKRASMRIADCGLWNAELEKRKAQGAANGTNEHELGEKRKDRGRRADDVCELFLWCSHPDIGKDAVGVKVLGDGDLLRMIEFTDHGVKQVVLGEEDLRGKEVLTFEVSRTWNPRRMGGSGDDRDLGVAVAANDMN